MKKDEAKVRRSINSRRIKQAKCSNRQFMLKSVTKRRRSIDGRRSIEFGRSKIALSEPPILGEIRYDKDFSLICA